MTDFFMKVNNPGKQYSSAMLMPGYDENGFPTIKSDFKNLKERRFQMIFEFFIQDYPNHRLLFFVVESKRISDLGKHFKDSVQALIQTSSPQVPVPEL